jgi:hypothetical protein
MRGVETVFHRGAMAGLPGSLYDYEEAYVRGTQSPRRSEFETSFTFLPSLLGTPGEAWHSPLPSGAHAGRHALLMPRSPSLAERLMPGLSLVCDLSERIDDRAVPRSSGDEGAGDVEQFTSILFRDIHVVLLWSGYPEYPISVHETGDCFIWIEGRASMSPRRLGITRCLLSPRIEEVSRAGPGRSR